MEEYLYEDLTHKIIGAAFDVYKELGYGFLEKIYERALIHELKSRGLEVESQKSIKVFYKGQSVGDYIADLWVDGKVIVELKAEKEINSKHEAQLINYLKATNLKVGLLINFGQSKCQPKRIVN
jgi:GxxExxY protein